MMAVDPVFAALTAEGSPFAIGERDGLRQFLHAPADLDSMIETARRFGSRTFIVEEADDGTQRRLSFDEVFAWRDQLAAMLHIKPGDRVAICMRNRAEWMIAFLAVIKVGGIAALLNSRGSPSELVAMIGEVTPALVLADGTRASLIREGGYAGRLFDLTDPLPAADAAAQAEPALPSHRARPDDPCVILFTSGTTGRVKGAVLSHRNFITGLMGVQLSGMQVLHAMASQLGLDAGELIARSPQQGVLLVYPLFHISGLGSAFLSPLLAGSKVVIMRRWDAERALRLIADERLTMFTGVPTMLWDVVHTARSAHADLSSLRSIASGGQALPVNLLEAIHALCPHAQMGTGYGMTECAGAIAQAIGAEYLARPSAAGKVLPLVDVRIEGPDGNSLAIGQAGEIVLRGAQVMLGYWNRPEETAAVLSDDRWLRTGDVGLVDEDGFIFIVDRKKDMVISGGENIYCAEVERALGEIPQVQECAAFGIPDDRLGELLVAVVRADGVDEAGIIAFVGERLARYKAPGRVALMRDVLPRNAVGKIDKLALRTAWPDLIGVL
jgi:long-chain acyl-CoA synthetase